MTKICNMELEIIIVHMCVKCKEGVRELDTLEGEREIIL